MLKYLLALFISFFFLSVGYGQVLPTANLSIVKTAGAGPFLPDNLVTFTMTATNNGPDNAPGVVLTDLLPTGLTFVSAAAPTGQYDADSGVLSVGTLNTGASLTFTLVARITAPAGTVLRNTATVQGEVTDVNPANNSAAAQVAVVPVPASHTDLSVTKTITPGPYLVGDNVTYTVKARNTGTTPATGVAVADLLPPKLTLVQATGRPGTYAAATGTYAVGTLMPGDSATLTLVATINTSGLISNTATVTAGPGTPVDRNNTNNEAIRDICVLPAEPTRLEINSSELTRNVCTGQPAEFKVPVVSGALEYQYSFPAGFTIVRQLGSIIHVIPGPVGGNVTVTAVNACGSSSAITVPVTVSVIPPAPAVPTGPAAPCTGAEVVYTIPSVAQAAAYSWSLPAGWVIISGGTTPSVTVRVGDGAGNVEVKAANICGGGSTNAAAVNPVLTPPVPVIADSSNACAGLRYSVAPLAGDATYAWTVPDGWTISSGQGTAMIAVKAPDSKAAGTIAVVAQNGACASPPATFQALASRSNGLLDLPTAFSPNGDNQNDSYVIGNLEKYPDNDILIINRWGNQVFKQVNYQNNWVARDLNDGTYFYVLRVKACNNEQKIYRGYITVAR
jgi:uncharacterized repeat protein (TIGR01451 family)/gliding motility-associated-like protein